MSKKKDISLDTIVKRIEDIDATDLNGEKVMMNLEKGQYFAINEVGSKIWDIIKEPIAVKNISETLLKEYNIEAAICQEDVIEFLGKMNDAELISIN